MFSHSSLEIACRRSFLMLYITFLFSMLTVGAQPINHAYDFTPTVKGDFYPNVMSPTMKGTQTAFTSGQEVRFRFYTQYGGSVFSAGTAGSVRAVFNVTNMRIRIINAYSSRATTGTTAVKCNASTSTDVWAEFWTASSRWYQWGNQLSTHGQVTFTVPPFPFKVCVKVIADNYNSKTGWKQGTNITSNYVDKGRDKGWADLTNQYIQRVNTTAQYLWWGADDMFVNDYAAIKITQNGFRHTMYYPTQNSLLDGDNVKLVPSGFPCTHELPSSHDIAGTAVEEYCGSNAVFTSSGIWYKETCAKEGSVTDGVARVGTNKLNPYAAYITYDAGAVSAPDNLVAYLRLPAAGSYDICYSPMALRKTSRYVFTRFDPAFPVWYKVFKATTGCPTTSWSSFSSSCKPTSLQLTTTASRGNIRWSTKDNTPGTWGSISIRDITGSATLSNGKATLWEKSSTKEFFTTVGGDQFRMIRVALTKVNTKTYGTLLTDSLGNRWKTTVQTRSSAGRTTGYESVNRIEATASTTYGATGDYMRQYILQTPDYGTTMNLATDDVPGGGCWYNREDNYGDYSKGLNGITSTFRDVYTNGGCCVGGTDCTTTSCSMSDSGTNGVTASADLGGNPRSYQTSWREDSSSTNNVWAYVRMPTQHQWYICYRRAGTQNWRILQSEGTLETFEAGSPKTNYTYHVNDTRAGTLAKFVVMDQQRQLNTLAYGNYWTSSVSDANVVGSWLKLVPAKQSCYVDLGVVSNMNPGLMECEIENCQFSTTCTGCTGSADDSSTLRSSVVFYVTLPQRTDEGYRVCFKKGAKNWAEIHDRTFRLNSYRKLPSIFNTLPQPRIDYTLMDLREGTWAKLFFRRREETAQPFNIDKTIRGRPGDIVRLIPNRTSRGLRVNCDVTWGITTTDDVPAMQMFDPSKTFWDLGLYCVPGVTSSRCSESVLAPSNGDYFGTYPYTDIDATADGSYLSNINEGSVALFVMPTQNTQAYKVCYKQQAMNWMEISPTWDAPRAFFITKKSSHQVSFWGNNQQLTEIIAGSYGYVLVQGDTINLDSDLLKFVQGTQTCENAAVGTQSYLNKYLTFSWRASSDATGRRVWTEGLRGGQALVRNSNPNEQLAALGSRGTTTSARFYLTFPTLNNNNQATTAYRVCYMNRNSGSDANRNWQDMGTVNVKHLGITYTAMSQPYNGGSTTIRFMSTSQVLNSMPYSGDRAKVIPISDACIGSEHDISNRPYNRFSKHVGQEMYLVSNNVTAMEDGNTDLGPSDLPRNAFTTMSLTLPWDVLTPIYYKICYRLVGQPWIEVEQTSLSNRVVNLGQDAFLTKVSMLSEFNVDSALAAQSPFPDSNYGKFSFSNVLIGGMSTSAIIEYPNRNASYFFVSFVRENPTVLKDEYKFVLESIESEAGVVSQIPGITCESTGVVTGVPGAGTTTLRANIVTNLPTGSGRYLFCYKKFDTQVWIQVKDGTAGIPNPLFILKSFVSFSKFNRNVLVLRDFYAITNQGQDYGLGALYTDDKVYIVNQTDVCGLAHGFAYPLVASAAYTKGEVFLGSRTEVKRSDIIRYVPQLTLPVTPGMYKVCYYRSQRSLTNATQPGNVYPIPFAVTGWYQVPSETDFPFEATIKANRLRINGCPAFNLTSGIRPGNSFDVSVTVLDDVGNPMQSALGVHAYRISAVAQNDAFLITNALGECRAAFAPLYDWPNTGVHQWTRTGTATFRISILSSCPASGCGVTFTASDGISAPLSPVRCLMGVRRTLTTTLSWAITQKSCHVDDPCPLQFVGFAADQMISYADVVPVRAFVSGFGIGLQVAVNGKIMDGINIVEIGTYQRGSFDALLTFAALNGKIFTADTEITVQLYLRDLLIQTKIIVLRPVLTKLVIADVYPESIQYADTPRPGDAYVRDFMVPSWESTDTYFTSEVSPTSSKSSITAAPGYYFVAQQHYNVLLLAFDQYNRRINQDSLVFGNTFTVRVDGFGVGTNKNAILDKCSTSEHCNVAIPSTIELVKTKQIVTFRVRNSQGCSINAPCAITLPVNGGTLPGGAVSITTPVRSFATSFKVTCWSSAQEVGTTIELTRSNLLRIEGVTEVCPSSNVNVGWTLRIQALDQFGVVDEYYEGNALLEYAGTTQGVNVSTLPDLIAGRSVGRIAIPFTQGVGWLHKLTLTKPCSQGCSFVLLSDWGVAAYESTSLVALPNTARLQCELSTTLFRCSGNDINAPCTSTSGTMIYDTVAPENNARSVIYRDTVVCARVTAVTEDGISSLYETNWIMYWVQTVSGPVTQVTDAGDSPSRVKALVRSSQQFCFRVSSSNVSTFRVRFAAQKFGTPHWSQTNKNGECSLGTFSVWPQKIISSIGVSGVTGDLKVFDSTLPSTSVKLYGSRVEGSDAPLSTTLSFVVRDLYGNPFSTSDFFFSDTTHNILIRSCKVSDLSTRTCETQTQPGATSGPTMNTLNALNTREGGLATATVAGILSAVSGTNLQYTLYLTKHCLGCFVQFALKDTSNNDVLATLVSVSFYVTLYREAQKYVAFRATTSPLRSYWQLWDSKTKSNVSLSKGNIVLFKDSCFVAERANCGPQVPYFTPSMCDASRPAGGDLIAADAKGTPLDLYMVGSEKRTGALDTASEPQCAANNCDNSVNIHSQVDILNSYTIGFRVGNQLLSCAPGGTATCTDEFTAKPTVTLPALGDSALTAIQRYIAQGHTFSSVKVAYRGTETSQYFIANADGTLPANIDYPQFYGAVTISADLVNATRVPTPIEVPGFLFAFKPPPKASRFTLSSTSKEGRCIRKATYPCHSTTPGDVCAYDGYAKSATLDDIAYTHAYVETDTSTIIPVNFDVPLTFQVEDDQGRNVATASGFVEVVVYSWKGCNNGGTLTVKDAGGNGTLAQVLNGRATAFVRFSAPCELCVLKATLTPASDQSELYNVLLSNPALLTQYTKPLNVRNVLPTSGTHIVSTTNPSDFKSDVTVADRFTMQFIPVRRVGSRMRATDPNARVRVTAHSRAIAGTSNFLWFGNGGMLSSGSTGAVVNPGHHAVIVTAENSTLFSLTFAFSRTCYKGCMVTIAYTINGVLNTFLVKNALGTTFTVRSLANTKPYLVGFRPRATQRNAQFSVTAWHVGSDDPSRIPIAGVALTSLRTVSQLRVDPTDRTNGDGGILTVTKSVLGDRYEIHRAFLTSSCNRCDVYVGDDMCSLNVRSPAVTIRTTSVANTNYDATYPMITPDRSSYFSFDMFAVDALGFIDTWASGVYSGCFAYIPPFCNNNTAQPLVCEISASPNANVGFTPTSSTFLLGPANRQCVLASDSKALVDGVLKGARMYVETPLRNGYPAFSVNGVSSANVLTTEPIVMNVGTGNVGLSLSSILSVDSTKVTTATPILIYYGVTRQIDAGYYVSTEMQGTVKVTLSDSCPANSLGSNTVTLTVTRGLAMLNVTFTSPNAVNSQCTITASFTAAIAGSSCITGATCVATNTFAVTAPTVTSWVWLQPTSLDNGPGMPAGPYFAAMEARQTLTIGLRGKSAGVDVNVKSCDNPLTPQTELCMFKVSIEPTCTTRPVIITDNPATFDENGQSSITLRWPSAAGVYTCAISASVSNQESTLTGPINTVTTVEVCQPYRLVAVTNLTGLLRPIASSSSFPFQVAITDPTGRQCKGDSQDDGTQLTLEVLNPPKSSAVISVVNANTTFTKGIVGRTASVRGGSFTFQLWFSGSTMRNATGSLRLRVTAKGFANFSQFSNVITSSLFDTEIAATRLTWGNNIVTTGRLFLVQGRRVAISVSAVDGLDASWFNKPPNQAALPSEYGNNARVTWKVEPLPPFASFPLRFENGTREATLVGGQSSWVFTWEGTQDRDYNFYVEPLDNFATRIERTTPLRIIVQTISRIQTSSTLGNCTTTDCVLLPSELGKRDTNVYAKQVIEVPVIIADANGAPVEGDQDSWVSVQIVGDRSDVFLSNPPSYSSRIVNARATNGRVVLRFAFVGTTLNSTTKQHTPIQVKIFCPDFIPGTNITNPCLVPNARTLITSNRLYVMNNDTVTVPQAVWDSVVSKRPVVKIPTGLTSLTSFNYNQMVATTAEYLAGSGMPYVYPGMLQLTVCVVVKDKFTSTSDLSGTCGPTMKCSSPGGVGCPSGIVMCLCPGSVNSTLKKALDTHHQYALQLMRKLQQVNSNTSVTNNVTTNNNTTNSTANNQTTTNVTTPTGTPAPTASPNGVQMELTFDLQSALGYNGTSEAAILAEYDKLKTATINILTNVPSYATDFGILPNKVSTRTSDGAGTVTTLPPQTGPVQTDTPAPSTQPPTPSPVEGVNGAAGTQTSWFVGLTFWFVAVVLFF